MEDIRKTLEETRDYKVASKSTGISVANLRLLNSRYWHIQITPWPREKLEFLKQKFGTTSDKILADELGLSSKQVQSKARKLKLYKSDEYLNIIRKETAKNIASGPTRHQSKSGEGPPIYFGAEHPNWISDRSKIKGRRRKQHRFSVIIERQTEMEQLGYCNRCDTIPEMRKEFDHIIPVSIGGSSMRENCQMLCEPCHLAKTKQERRLTHNYNPTYKDNFIARTIE